MMSGLAWLRSIRPSLGNVPKTHTTTCCRVSEYVRCGSRAHHCRDCFEEGLYNDDIGMALAQAQAGKTLILAGSAWAHLSTGDGCTTTTSMPLIFTSAAREAANVVRKALVAPYMTDMGHGINPAEDDVKVTRPGRRLLSMSLTKWCVILTDDVALT